jgi:hypothetical protein
MARWDKFLNRASQGYGVGFERYGQYADARDERLNRTDAKSAYEAQQRAMADQAVQSEQFSVPGQPQALPTTSAATQPAAPPTAVDTGGATPPTPTRAIKNTDMMSASAQGPTVPFAQMATGPTAAADVAADAFEGTGAGLPAAPNAGVVPPLRAPKAEPPGKKIVPDETQPVAKKASTKAAISETLSSAVDPKTKQAVMEGGTGTRYVKGATRAQDWQTMKDKLVAIAIRKGDYEAVMGLDAKINAMQQAKVTEHTTNAIRLLQTGDTQGAAEALYQANGYYPDGTDLKLRMQPDGSLVGYGFDEATGEFQGGVAITAESLTSQLQAIQDPIAFQEKITASKLASEEKSYSRAQDKKEWALKKFDSESEHMLNLSQAAENRAEAWTLFHENMGGTNGGQWMGAEDDLRTLYKDYQSHVNGVFGGTAPGNNLTAGLMSGMTAGIAPSTVASVGNALIAESGPGAQLSPSEVLDISSELSLLSAIHSGVDLSDLEEDRQWDGWIKERKAGGGPIRNVIHDPTTGATGFIYNGRPYTLPSSSLRGLSAVPTDAQRASAAKQQEQTQAVPAAPALPSDPASVAGREGQALSNMGQAVGNAVSGAWNAPPATGNFSGSGRIAQEQ